MYEVPLLPRAEALGLVGGKGPLAVHRLPGVMTAGSEGGLTLDRRALLSLAHLGCVSGTIDGRVIYEEGLPVLLYGNARFAIHEA